MRFFWVRRVSTGELLWEGVEFSTGLIVMSAMREDIGVPTMFVDRKAMSKSFWHQPEVIISWSKAGGMYISQSANKPVHVHTDEPLVQIGWWGQTGRVYGLEEGEEIRTNEPGGFSPIYAHWGERCGHQIRAEEMDE